jgi:hypothetical protein
MKLATAFLGLALASPFVTATASAQDVFDPNTKLMSVNIASVGDSIFRNAVVVVDTARLAPPFDLFGPPLYPYDVYNPTTGQLLLSSVRIAGTDLVAFNVPVFISQVVLLGTVTPRIGTPLTFVPHSPLPPAQVGRPYSRSMLGHIFPEDRYTFTMDTLGNGSLPTGMTLDLNGLLSGTPFATGSTDVQGAQTPRTYTFGVCATNTLTRVTTSPCPQTSIIVNPATFSITTTVVGSGSVSASLAGPDYPQGTKVTLTATAGQNSTFSGWSGACSISPCLLTMNSAKAVTATFTSTPQSLAGRWTGTWQWSGPGSNGCPFKDVGAMSVTLAQAGTTLSSSNVSADGIEFRLDGSCALDEMLSGTGGSMSLVPSGSSYTLTWGVLALSFTGTATVTGSKMTGTFVRNTGGTGSFTLTRQ